MSKEGLNPEVVGFPAKTTPTPTPRSTCPKRGTPSPESSRGMLEADEAFFKQHGEPLFSSHMLDLSEEVDEASDGVSDPGRRAKKKTERGPGEKNTGALTGRCVVLCLLASFF